MRTTREFFRPRVSTPGLRRAFVTLSSICFTALAAWAGAAAAPKLDATTRQAILDCTFEVVAQMRGSEAVARTGDAASLLRVAGSASCVGDGELATAAHVFDQVLGGRFDPPFVRDRAGRVYPVDRILRYSMRDDFVVFTAKGLPALAARPHNTTGEFGNTLNLAWRRSDQDIVFGSTQYRGRSTVANLGRDGWIQFGPAPGHGASGAALLDDAGRVIGLINSRSSENSDAQGFAVPIAVLEAASTAWADIAMRDPLRTLGMPSERNLPLIGGIPLPATLARFERHMIDVRNTYFLHVLPYSLSLSGIDAPMSDAQRGGLCAAMEQGYCDGARGIASATPVRAVENLTARRTRGCEVAWSGIGAALVRCNARDAIAASRMADNARAQMVSVSLGRRFAAVPPAPCTSDDPLDSPVAQETFADHTGAEWQVREYPVRGCDWVVLSMSRAISNGTLTFVRGAPSAYADAAAMQLKALTAIKRDGDQVGDGEVKDAVLAELGGAPGEVIR